MDRKITVLSGAYVLFLVLLFASGSVAGIVSEIIYFSAFILPLVFAMLLSDDRKISLAEQLKIDKNGITVTLFTVFPTISVVLIISVVTSIVIEKLTGTTNQVDIGDSLVFAVINHALLPGVLEEMLFRYLPMRLLMRHSRVACLFVSAFFFSLVHHDLFSIPYAFAAGVVFMLIDMMCDSIVPSLIVHFINNLISVLLIYYAENNLIKSVCIGVVAVCTIISIVVIIIRKNEYRERIKNVFVPGEKMKFNFSMLMFAVACLVFAVIGLA